MRGLDSFVRANQSGIGTASDGEAWAATGGGTLSIAANQVVIVSAGADTQVQLGSQTGKDMIVQATLSINNASDICGVEARFSSASGSSCYKVLFYSADIHINKTVNGSGTNLVNFGGFTMTPNTLYIFKIAVVGTSIKGKVWANGSVEPGWLMSTTDAAITSGGFALLGQTNGGSTGVQCANFLAMAPQPLAIRPVMGIARRITA
jgi:hypothetical protein